MPRRVYQRFSYIDQRTRIAVNGGGAGCGLWTAEPHSKSAKKVLPFAVGRATKALQYFGPEFYWIDQAAEAAVELRPRPCREHLIHYFRRVSYHYCLIVMGKKRGADPVERFVHARLAERLELARNAINNPKGALIMLQQRAIKYNWPAKVLERKLRILKTRVRDMNKTLRISELRDFLSDLRFILDERDLIETEIRDMWRRGSKHGKGRKNFVKSLEALQLRLRKNRILFERLHMQRWQSWLESQVVEIFYELEDDILRMAKYGKRSDRHLKAGRTEIKGVTDLVHRRELVIVADTEEWGQVSRVWAVTTLGKNNHKVHTRLKPKDRAFCNRAPRALRRRIL